MPTHRPPQGFPERRALGLNKDNPQLHDVYHLDLTTGQLEKVVENPGFLGWVVDADLKVRGAVTPTARRRRGDHWCAMTRLPTGARCWRRRRRMRNRLGRVGFTKDGTGMYLQTSIDSNTGRLVKMDIANGCHRGDRRGPGLRHHRRDHEPRHPRDRRRDRVRRSGGVPDIRRLDARRRRSASAAQ